MRVIKRNRIRCKKCGDIIESTWVHDFKECSCGACFVDGGREYCRIGGDTNDIEMLIEYEEVPGCLFEYKSYWGTYHSFSVALAKAKENIKHYEDIGEYVRITDDDGVVIYETPGFDEIS